MVLGFTLVESIEPIPVVRFVFRQRRRHQVAFVVLLTEGPGQILPDQIDLPRTDEDVMASPLLEGLKGGERIDARVKSSVNYGIEALGSNRSLQILLAASVPIDALDAMRKLRGSNTAIEDGNRMPALTQKFHQRQAKVARSTDDQNSDRPLL